MKKILTVVISLTLLSSPVMAASNQGYMRDLTIETMLNYAKELYQRGDFKESRNVMARIKQLNRNQMQPATAKQKNAKPMSCCMETVKAQPKPIEVAAVAVDPNDDLREAIAKEDRILSELNRDVDALRLEIQATHHE